MALRRPESTSSGSTVEQCYLDPCKLWTGGKQDVIEDATAILFDEYRKMSEAGLPHPHESVFSSA